MADTNEIRTPSDLLRRLRVCDILSSTQLATARELLTQTSSVTMYARRLVARGVLTRWQAKQLLAGGRHLRLGNYVLAREIGRSTLGRIFLAEHLRLKREVAIKTLSRRFAQRPDIVQQFLEDARRIAGLNHRNLVHVLDVDEADGWYYVVMEYLTGSDLQHLVQQQGPLPSRLVAEYVSQAADGLEHAHEAGLVHLDLHPASLMVDHHGVVKVLGWGSAAAPDTARLDNTDAPASERARYLAPEQRAGTRAGSVTSDICALGRVAFYLLTGQPPDDVPDDTASGLGDDPVRGRSCLSWPALPAQLVGIFQKMTDPRPAERFPSAREANNALRRWLNDSAVPLPGDSVIADESGSPPLPALELPRVDTTRRVADLDAAALKTTRAATDPSGGRFHLSRRRGGLLAGLLAVCLLVGVSALAFWRSGGPVGEEPPMAEASATVAHDRSFKSSRPPLRRRPTGEPTSAGPPSPAAPRADEISTDEQSVPDEKSAPPMAVTESAATAAVPPSGGEAVAPSGSSATPPNAAEVVADGVSKPPSSASAAGAPRVPTGAEFAENPFRDFPSAIDLPELDSAASEEAAAAEQAVPIGSLDPVLANAVTLSLLGGLEAAGGAGEFRLQAERSDAAACRWIVQLVTTTEAGRADLPMATLQVGDGQLRFAWEEAARAHVRGAYVRNCVLRFAVAKHVHDVRLRRAGQVEPLMVDLQRPSYSQRWPLSAPPDPAHVRFEILRLQAPFPTGYSLEPMGAITANAESQWVQFGADLGLHFLLLELRPQLGNTFRLECRAFFQVSPQVEKIPLTPRRFETAATFVAQKQTQDNLVAQQLRAAVVSLNPADTQRKVAEEQLRRAEVVLAETSAATERIEELSRIRESLTGGAAIDYRLFFRAGDCEVDLLRTKPAAP